MSGVCNGVCEHGLPLMMLLAGITTVWLCLAVLEAALGGRAVLVGVVLLAAVVVVRLLLLAGWLVGSACQPV